MFVERFNRVPTHWHQAHSFVRWANVNMSGHEKEIALCAFAVMTANNYILNLILQKKVLVKGDGGLQHCIDYGISKYKRMYIN